MFNIAKLLPSEGKFYTYLEQLSAEAHTSATHLKTLVETTDAGARAEAAAAITACRAQAKSISAEVTRQLCLTFITPFDREDIQLFSNYLYRITKTTEKVREYIELYKLSDLSDFTRQVEVIIQEADGMDNMVHALIKGGKPKQIIEKAELLDSLENKGDAILSELLATLIEKTEKARDLIAKKDIYDLLERVIDGYRDAAGVALQISLKHS
ncbi:MAG: DUF47 family protein [Micavibrio sp.]|nr:DUF47 family protein [Micavibrio sp.]